MKIKYFLLILFFSSSLFANLRAPKVLSQYPSYPLSKAGNQLIVKSESLEFDCPKYLEVTNDTQALFLDKHSCSISAIYTIESGQKMNFGFEFISPSKENANIAINSGESFSIKAMPFTLKENDKIIYRISRYCNECKKESLPLYKLSFSGNLEKGLNTIKVQYLQPLGYSETSHGYFSSSKWSNDFSYELWPLKEWTLDPNFSINVKFTTEREGWINKMFSSKNLRCNGEMLKYKSYPLPVFKKEYSVDIIGTGASTNEDQPNPFFDLRKLSNDSERENKIIYELKFENKFPDRLNCSFGDLRNYEY